MSKFEKIKKAGFSGIRKDKKLTQGPETKKLTSVSEKKNKKIPVVQLNSKVKLSIPKMVKNLGTFLKGEKAIKPKDSFLVRLKDGLKNTWAENIPMLKNMLAFAIFSSIMNNAIDFGTGLYTKISNKLNKVLFNSQKLEKSSLTEKGTRIIFDNEITDKETFQSLLNKVDKILMVVKVKKIYIENTIESRNILISDIVKGTLEDNQGTTLLVHFFFWKIFFFNQIEKVCENSTINQIQSFENSFEKIVQIRGGENTGEEIKIAEALPQLTRKNRKKYIAAFLYGAITLFIALVLVKTLNNVTDYSYRQIVDTAYFTVLDLLPWTKKQKLLIVDHKGLSIFRSQKIYECVGRCFKIFLRRLEMQNATGVALDFVGEAFEILMTTDFEESTDPKKSYARVLEFLLNQGSTEKKVKKLLKKKRKKKNK